MAVFFSMGNESDPAIIWFYYFKNELHGILLQINFQEYESLIAQLNKEQDLSKYTVEESEINPN